MAATFEARQKQRAVIEFLVAEGETSLKIHNRMKNVYKDNTIDSSNVKRWIQRFKKSTEDHEEVGKASIADKPRSGHPSTSVNPENKTYADELIRTDRRITVEELASKLDVSIGSAHSIVASLGYSKVCAHWVPRQLTEGHKTERVRCCTQLLEHHQGDPTFLERIITGDETWVYHFEPESKRRSMEWRHPNSPRTKKFKAQKSAAKIMATVFWDSQGVILLDFLPKGETINSEVYIETFRKLKAKIECVRPNLDIANVLLQHDNARPHTSIRTMEAITSFGWTVIPHPPYSPDLARSDYHLFGPMKERLRGNRYGNDNEVKTAVLNFLRHQPAEFYNTGIHAIVHRWTVALEKGGDYVEK